MSFLCVCDKLQNISQGRLQCSVLSLQFILRHSVVSKYTFMREHRHYFKVTRQVQYSYKTKYRQVNNQLIFHFAPGSSANDYKISSLQQKTNNKSSHVTGVFCAEYNLLRWYTKNSCTGVVFADAYSGFSLVTNAINCGDSHVNDTVQSMLLHR